MASPGLPQPSDPSLAQTPAEERKNSRLAGADRKRQLLDAALTVFAQRGYGGATTKEVAAIAGVTEAIVFRHFASKQELYTATLDYAWNSESHQKWLQAMASCIEANDDYGLLHTLAVKIISSFEDDPRLTRILLFASLEGHTVGLEHYRKNMIPVSGMLSEYVARRLEQGAFQGDPASILFAIAGAAHHYGLMTQMLCAHASHLTASEAASNFTRIILDGVRPREANPDRKPSEGFLQP